MAKWELTVFQDAAINCRQLVIYFGESLAKRVSLPISRARLDVLMKQYGEFARIPKEKRHFHALKHPIATYLLEAAPICASHRIGSDTPTSEVRLFTPPL